MADRQNKKESNIEIYFQTVHLDVFNPVTGEQKTYSFIGPAAFSPDEIEQLKSTPVVDLIQGIEIEAPYNPFEDEQNTRAQKLLVDRVRNMLLNEEKQ